MGDMTHRRAELDRLHGFSARNRAWLGSSDRAACFHCLSEYPASAVAEWVDDGQTALCPVCSIDSVLPGAVAPTDDPLLLQAMHDRWFSIPADTDANGATADIDVVN